MEDFPIDTDDIGVSGESWTSNVLILDAIFGALGVSDLKMVRLVSKQWAVTGAKALLRKTVTRLTGNVPEEGRTPGCQIRQEQLVKTSDADSWLFHDDEEKWNIRRYSSFESYLIYLTKSVVFDSGFHPRNVSIMYSRDLWRLPIDFSYLEELQIVYMSRVDLYIIILGIHRFPNLRSLDLINYKINNPTDEPEILQCTDSCNYREQSAVPKVNRLENLTIRYPIVLDEFELAHWSDLLRNFRNLKKVGLNFCCDQIWLMLVIVAYNRHFLHLGVDKEYDELFYFPETQFRFKERAYTKFFVQNEGFVPVLMHIKDLSFRLTCETGNMALILSNALNKLSPETLALQLTGKQQAIEQLIQDLGPRCLDALAILRVSFKCFGELEFEEDSCKILAVLGDKGFFKKSDWSCLLDRCPTAWRAGGWTILTKSHMGLFIQIRSYNIFMKYPCEFVETLLSMHPELAAGCNYAFFHRVSNTGTGTNVCEAVGQEMVSNPHKWLTSSAAAVPENPSSSPLLCDRPEFFQQVAVNLISSKRFSEPNVSTFTFCSVAQDFLD